MITTDEKFNREVDNLKFGFKDNDITIDCIYSKIGRNEVLNLTYKVELGERENGLYGIKSCVLDDTFLDIGRERNLPENEKTQVCKYIEDNNIDTEVSMEHLNKYINPNNCPFKELVGDMKKAIAVDFNEYIENKESPSTFKTKRFKESVAKTVERELYISSDVRVSVKHSADLKSEFDKVFKKQKKLAVNKSNSYEMSM